MKVINFTIYHFEGIAVNQYEYVGGSVKTEIVWDIGEVEEISDVVTAQEIIEGRANYFQRELKNKLHHRNMQIKKLKAEISALTMGAYNKIV